MSNRTSSRRGSRRAPTNAEPAAPTVMLTRDDIVGAPDGRTYVNVPVDEWKPGGVVRISSLTAEMRDELENYIVKQREAGTQQNVRAFYVWLCAVDENGDRLFTDPEDVKVLGKKSALPIERIFAQSVDINSVSEAAIGRAAKNSASEGGGD